MQLFRKEVEEEKYIIATYYLKSKTSLRDAAWNLAIGQSVGNPNVRNEWETDELFENHSCKILADEKEISKIKEGKIEIAFPLANLNVAEDGVTQLLVQLMGGQMDIDNVLKCHLLNVHYPDSFLQHFLRPKYGISGIREFTKSYDKPLLGGIVKPKVGISPETLLELVKQLVEGGVDFIKEDEIMSNPACCPIEVRVPLIMDYLKDKNVIYAVCINSDYPYVIDRVKKVYEYGANAVHINFWNGLGVYKSIRNLDLDMFLFFQKSGDQILTNKNHDYHIDWNVVCELAGLMGVDFIHAGMWGGYKSDNEEDLKETLSVLHKNNVMPSLSCGMHPGLIEAINSRFGMDYMANVGGAIHGHPMGTEFGAKAMRQSIDREYGNEYHSALKKWGLIK